MRTFILASGIGMLTVVAYSQQPAAPQTLQVLAPPTAQVVAPQQTVDETPKVTGEKPMSFWMARKLDFSKSILESLTKGDF